MTGPTHKVFSVSFAFLTVMLLYKLSISSINYYLMLPIVLEMSKRGALFPDIDHDWSNISTSSKTVPNKIINVLIHITGGKHRSWQTHSIDICLAFTFAGFFIPYKMYEAGAMSLVNKEVASIILVGFASGWISHLYSDMWNGVGVRLFCFVKFKLAFVPKKIGKLRFNTGNEWEAFCFRTVSVLNKVLGLTCLVFPYLTVENFELVKGWVYTLIK